MSLSKWYILCDMSKMFYILQINFIPKCCQDLAAGGQKPDGGAKNQKGGHIFKIQYWMYAATGGPNVKRGAPISNRGGGGTTSHPAGDGPVDLTANQLKWQLCWPQSHVFCYVTVQIQISVQIKSNKNFWRLTAFNWKSSFTTYGKFSKILTS